ncbi:hypothetical protein NJLHNGOC_12085 [Novacetimonas cocois]|uniref:Uncharacterized protein n=2 Tax=Novacetimonas cocois TaxID=1747507 RepID=A0A365YUY4_9PROT|nr:hypothetical protein NJLHNGOC_12085 [Novacetimonas cocois]
MQFPENHQEVFGEAFCKSFEERRLFEKRRHPKTFVNYQLIILNDPLQTGQNRDGRVSVFA